MTDLQSSADKVYAKPHPFIENFSFDEKVASVFSDMIQRSIPGYQSILNQLGQFTQQFSQANANYYDLGCSLGAATLAMRQNINQPNGHIIAIDNSPAMIERCKNHVLSFNYPTPVSFHCHDIQSMVIENAAIVTLNFTLQFIQPAQRQAIVNQIYQGLKPGDILFLSEKLTFSDPIMNQCMIDTHHQFKRANGYSDLEISQKRTALENVMIPDTSTCHLKRMEQAGFNHCCQWYQHLNFASFIAIK